MNIKFTRKIYVYVMVLFLLFSINLNNNILVNASNGKLLSSSIINCNNVIYGKHGTPAHWHKASAKNYATGPELKQIGTCKFSEISSINENKTINYKKINVTLKRVIDGDTAEFSKVGKVRFLMIDTPEMSTYKGVLAKKYTESLLKKAKKISVKYDSNASKRDRYKRNLMWVFVDNELLQKKIAKKGYVIKYYTKNGNATKNWKDIKLELMYVKQVRDSLFKKKGYWIN